MTSIETETRREDDARRAARIESYMPRARAFASLIAAIGVDTTDEAISSIAAGDSPAGAIADELIEMGRHERDGWTVATLDPDLLAALWLAGVLAVEPVYDASWVAWDGLGEVRRA